MTRHDKTLLRIFFPETQAVLEQTVTTETKPAVAPLTVGTRVRIEKGCKARGVDKGCSAQVTSVEPMGADYGHCVRVSLMMLNGLKSGKTLSFYARHANRLADVSVRMNDGNPSNTVELRRA